MKKNIAVLFAVSFFASFCAFSDAAEKSQKSDRNEKQGRTESPDDRGWAEIGEQGKKALSEAGKFFSDAGKKAFSETEKALSGAYGNLAIPKCHGKWVYRTSKSKTLIECREDGTMSVQQKSGGKTLKWTGVFTATGHTITFNILKANGKSLRPTSVWFFTYSLQEDGESMKIQSMNLPSDADGTNFKSSVLFKRHHLFA